MNKHEFMAELRARLCGVPRQDAEERINFYCEMIDDRIEEGLSEEDAVAQMGCVDDIAAEIISDIPLTKIAKERIKPKKQLEAWEFLLLAFGSPIWLTLAIVAVSVIFSVYVVLWSAIICLWAVFGALVGCAVGGVASGIVFAIMGYGMSGVAIMGAGIFCAGVAIFSFFGCSAATKGTAILTKKIVLGIKKCFVRKEEA